MTENTVEEIIKKEIVTITNSPKNVEDSVKFVQALALVLAAMKGNTIVVPK